MRGGPQVIWGAAGVFHRPRRSDPDRAKCGPLVIKPWLGETATESRALALGLRPCRQRACGLVETQHSPTRPVTATAGQEPRNAVPGGSAATEGVAA